MKWTEVLGHLQSKQVNEILQEQNMKVKDNEYICG